MRPRGTMHLLFLAPLLSGSASDLYESDGTSEHESFCPRASYTFRGAGRQMHGIHRLPAVIYQKIVIHGSVRAKNWDCADWQNSNSVQITCNLCGLHWWRRRKWVNDSWLIKSQVMVQTFGGHPDKTLGAWPWLCQADSDHSGRNSTLYKKWNWLVLGPYSWLGDSGIYWTISGPKTVSIQFSLIFATVL